MVPPVFTGGSLSFKGDKSKATRKKGRKSKHKVINENALKEQSSLPSEEYDLTEAERKALRYKDERARKELQSVAKKSHRERVEEFNEKLGNLTELNDIPRVSFGGAVQFKNSSNVMLTITLFLITGQCRRKWVDIDFFL
jgi:protein FAM32A